MKTSLESAKHPLAILARINETINEFKQNVYYEVARKNAETLDNYEQIVKRVGDELLAIIKKDDFMDRSPVEVETACRAALVFLAEKPSPEASDERVIACRLLRLYDNQWRYREAYEEAEKLALKWPEGGWSFDEMDIATQHLVVTSLVNYNNLEVAKYY